MGGVVEQMCDIERKLRSMSETATEATPAVLANIADQISKLCVDAAMTIEALDPILETDAARGRGGVLTLMDLCYNAFMIGRTGENREDGDRTAWFNDCQPLMLAGVDRIRKDVVARVEENDRLTRRRVERAIEGASSGLAPEQAEAGAACLYGHLDVSFTGGQRVDYQQASEHTKGKYRRAFAAATREANAVKVTEPA